MVIVLFKLQEPSVECTSNAGKKEHPMNSNAISRKVTIVSMSWSEDHTSESMRYNLLVSYYSAANGTSYYGT